jgi:hypothetical protein
MFPRLPLFDAESDAPTDSWSKWGMGIALPAVIAVYGLSRVILLKAALMGRRGHQISLTGWDAVAYGIAVMAVALFLNVHYFWSNSERLAEYVDLGKAVALLMGIASIGFIVVRNVSPI